MKSSTAGGGRVSDQDEIVIGVDMGTTSTKSVAYDVAGRVAASHSVGYPLHEPRPGYAEQDPDAILAAVVQTIASVALQCDSQVRALSFSSAMHSLIGLDRDGNPLTPVVTWADQRASGQAERLRAASGGLAVASAYRHPLHPMAPLPKLVWFREEEPELAARVRHWVGIKDYVLWKLLGVLVTDNSMASGTGLMDIQPVAVGSGEPGPCPNLARSAAGTGRDGRRWYPSCRRATASALQLPSETSVIVGAGDGPLANLGLGAVPSGRGGLLDRDQRGAAGDGRAANRGRAGRAFSATR